MSQPGLCSVESASGLTLSVLTDASMNEPRFMILVSMFTVSDVSWVSLMVELVFSTVLSTFELALSLMELPGKLLICLSFLVVRPPDFDFFRMYDGVLNP